MKSCLYECHLMHARIIPRPHRFAYRIFLFAIDLDELELLHRRLPWFSFNRPNLYSFREQDYMPTAEPLHNGSAGGRPAPTTTASLKQRVIDFAATQGVDLTDGRMLLVTLPRVAGYGFNPVSFYFCFDRDEAPVAAIAEVKNTFKEMKVYWIPAEQRTEDGRRRTDKLGQETPHLPSILCPPSSAKTFRARVPKYFYVSPYSDVDVAFDFQFRVPGDLLTVKIDDYVGTSRTLATTLRGKRCELSSSRLLWFSVKYPLITLRVIGLIHWQAVLLWFKRVPWFRKAARAADQRELYRPHDSLTAPTLHERSA